MEVNAMIQANRHADDRPPFLILVIIAKPFFLHELLPLSDLCLRPLPRITHSVKAWLQMPKAPQIMDPTDSPNEVRVRHIRQRRQMRLMPPGLTNPSPHPDPLPRALRMQLGAVTVQDLDALALKRAPPTLPLRLPGRGPAILLRRHDALGHGNAVIDRLVAARALPHERQGGGEDGPPALPRLHGARREGLAFAHVLDVVQHGQRRVARQHEVAVHAVDREVWGHRQLRRGEALRDHGAAEDAAGAWGVPEGPGVGEDVLLGERG